MMVFLGKGSYYDFGIYRRSTGVKEWLRIDALQF